MPLHAPACFKTRINRPQNQVLQHVRHVVACFSCRYLVVGESPYYRRNTNPTQPNPTQPNPTRGRAPDDQRQSKPMNGPTTANPPIEISALKNFVPKSQEEVGCGAKDVRKIPQSV